MKRQIITLLMSLFIIECVGQTLKTYSGPYEKGTATYTYYENKDLERVFHGKLEFTQTDIIGGLLKITGYYTDGQKSGKWIETYTNSKNPYNKEQNFKNGKLDGLSTAYFYNKAGLNVKENGLLHTTKINYENGFACGRFSISRPNTEELVGKINRQGLADSIWTIKGTIYKRIEGEYSPKPVFVEGKRTYKNGMLVESKIVEVSTGKFIEKYNLDTANTSSKYLKFYFNEIDQGVRFQVNNAETPMDVNELLDLEVPFSWKEKTPVLRGTPELIAISNVYVKQFKKHRMAYDSLINHNMFSEIKPLTDEEYKTKITRLRTANAELNTKLKNSFENLYDEFLFARITKYLCEREANENIDQRLNYLLNINKDANMLGEGDSRSDLGFTTYGNKKADTSPYRNIPANFYDQKDYTGNVIQKYEFLYKKNLLTKKDESVIEEMEPSFKKLVISEDLLFEEIKAMIKAELLK